MAFGDVRKCPACPATWIEDDQMYEDPEVCPHCGADAGDYMSGDMDLGDDDILPG